MTVPRLVATDLDGTLVQSDGTVSPRTREVLAAVEALGVPVVFVTGRPLRWAEEVFEHVGELGLAIVSNGALVWNVAAEKPRLERPIPAAVALEVAARLREAVPGTGFATETSEGFSLEPAFRERYAVPPGARRAPLEELLEGLADQPLLKLLARHEELEPLDYWRRAEDALGDLVTVTWSSSTTLLEMSAAGVTKATTLALVADGLGIAADEVVAFGDMPNDVPMLTWAGASYAMADGHPLTLEAARSTAPPHDQDGVASVLASIFGV